MLAREGGSQPPNQLLSGNGIFRADLHSRSVPAISTEVSVSARKGVVRNYAPCQIFI